MELEIDLKFAKKIMSRDYFREVERLYNNIFVMDIDGKMTLASKQRFIKILGMMEKDHWSQIQAAKK
jgi:hypothetical protein